MTNKTGTIGMHIWPINRIPWPHKLPALWHTHINTHASMLPASWLGETRSPAAVVPVGGAGRGNRRPWEGFECAMLITHKWPGPVVILSLMCHHTPGIWPKDAFLGVMGSSWTKVSMRTAEKKQTMATWQNSHNYHSSEIQSFSLLAH